MAAQEPATLKKTKFYYTLFGLHHIYLGNLIKGVLFASFLDPWPCFGWMVGAPSTWKTYYKNLVREANDDPTYDDEIKERIKNGKRPGLNLIDHYYCAFMAPNIIRFIIFNCKYNIFPDWNDAVATIIYLVTGLGTAFSVWACTQSKWVESSLQAVMIAGFISTVCLIFLDKGADPKYILYMVPTRDYLPILASFLTRRYKKTPSKFTGREHSKLGFILFLILMPTNALTTNNWIRSGTMSLLSGKMVNHGLPIKETFDTVQRIAGTPMLTRGFKLAFIDIHGKDKWRRKKAEKLIASLYAECYHPWNEEEMTPYVARGILEVDIGVEGKKLHKTYRDASRKWHPDKYDGDVKYAELMQEKISQAKTVLGLYNERFEDGLAYADQWRRYWNPNSQYLASTKKKEEGERISLDDPAAIKYLAEAHCDQMKTMYKFLYEKDLMDVGSEEADCTTLAENFQQLLNLYNEQVPPEKEGEQEGEQEGGDTE